MMTTAGVSLIAAATPTSRPRYGSSLVGRFAMVSATISATSTMLTCPRSRVIRTGSSCRATAVRISDQPTGRSPQPTRRSSNRIIHHTSTQPTTAISTAPRRTGSQLRGAKTSAENGG